MARDVFIVDREFVEMEKRERTWVAKVFSCRPSLAASHVDDGSRGDDQQIMASDRGHEDQADPKQRVGRERQRHVRLGRDADRVGPARAASLPRS